MSGSVLAYEYLQYGQYERNNGYYLPKTKMCPPVNKAAALGLGEIASFDGIGEDDFKTMKPVKPEYAVEMQNGCKVVSELPVLQETAAKALAKAAVENDTVKMTAILEGYDPLASALITKMQANVGIQGEWDFELDFEQDIADMQRRLLNMKVSGMTVFETAKLAGKSSELAMKLLVQKYSDKSVEIAQAAKLPVAGSIPKNASFSAEIAPMNGGLIDTKVYGALGASIAADSPDANSNTNFLVEQDDLDGTGEMPESIERLWEIVDRDLLKACFNNDLKQVKKILDGNTEESMSLLMKMDSVNSALGEWDRSIDFNANLPLMQNKLLNAKLNYDVMNSLGETNGNALYTPLMVACATGNIPLMTLLIKEYGADPTFQHPTTKNTALFSAFTKNSSANQAAAELLVKELAKNGQFRNLRNARNAQDMAAIDLAKSLKWDPLAEMIQGFMQRSTSK